MAVRGVNFTQLLLARALGSQGAVQRKLGSCELIPRCTNKCKELRERANAILVETKTGTQSLLCV